MESLTNNKIPLFIKHNGFSAGAKDNKILETVCTRQGGVGGEKKILNSVVVALKRSKLFPGDNKHPVKEKARI